MVWYKVTLYEVQPQEHLMKLPPFDYFVTLLGF